MLFKKILGTKVLMKRHPVEDMLESGSILFAPKTRIDKNQKCTVIKSGPGRWIDGRYVPTGLKPGDVVLLPPYLGEKFTQTDKEGHMVMEEESDLILVEDAWIEAIMENELPDPKAMEIIKANEQLEKRRKVLS